jgi:hypothetical protein
MTKTRIAAIVAAATLGAGAFAGATMALAADDTPSPSSSTTSPGSAGQGEHGMRGERGGDHGPGDRSMGGPREGHGSPLLHSEGVMEDADGTFITVRMQEGELTAVSATSLSVTSGDGYTSTYVITDETVLERDGEDAAPKVGDTVHVRATVDGSTATAEHVHAMSPERAAEFEDQREAMEQWMSERPEGADGPGHGGPGHRGPGHGGPARGETGADPASAA